MSTMAPKDDVIPYFDGDYSFNTGTLKQFTIADFTIFATVLVISASIGFIFAWRDRKKRDVADFMLAGRNMHPLPVSLSLLASFMSAITLLGTPAEIYDFTTMYMYISIGYGLVAAGASFLYIPVFYRVNSASSYEYLERRFCKGVRTSASLIFVVQMTLYMAIVLYAPSLALSAVTGVSLWGAVVSVAVVCTLYTAFGGLKAVLWTDTFQVTMMFVALFTVLIQGCLVVGDWDIVWKSAERTHRIWFTDFRPDPTVRHSFWSLAIGGYFTWISVFGTNQAQIQRCIACSTLRRAQIAIWFNWPGLSLIMLLCTIIGLYIGAFYERCDPLKAKFITSSNQVLPMFVMDVLGHIPGLPGLFVAGLFSGALSTISSGLNSVSAVVLEDLVKAYVVKNMKEEQGKTYSQVISFLLGAVCLISTVLVSQVDSILQAAMSVFGVVGGPVLGLFTLGMFYPWANKWGAYSGLFGSLVLMTWIGIGSHIDRPIHEKSLRFTDHCNVTAFSKEAMASVNATVVPVEEPERSWAYPLYSISYLWYSSVAVVACNSIGLVVSFITGATNPAGVDPNLMISPCDSIYPLKFLPEKIKKPLRFGVDFSKQSTGHEKIDRNAKPGTELQKTDSKVVDEDDKLGSSHQIAESQPNTMAK